MGNPAGAAQPSLASDLPQLLDTPQFLSDQHNIGWDATGVEGKDRPEDRTVPPGKAGG